MLTPRVAPMDKLIKELELRGRGLNLNELDVREASGDWTRTSFSDVDLNRRYTPAEQAKFFTLPERNDRGSAQARPLAAAARDRRRRRDRDARSSARCACA